MGVRGGVGARPQTAAALGAPAHHPDRLVRPASMLSLPLQVNLPIAAVDGLPVGLGLVGPPGSDEDLLSLAEALMEILPRRP